MANVLIVYATDYGSTKKMAEALAVGAGEVEGAEVILRNAEDVTRDEVLACDALVLGSPVHMGSMDRRVKAFIDNICGGLWMKDAMIGRVGAVFVSGGGYGGAGTGCELTMLSMLNNLVELGMLIVPLPKNTPGYAQGGLQWGPYGRSAGEDGKPFEGGLPEERTVAAHNHGRHVARAAAAIKEARIFGD